MTSSSTSLPAETPKDAEEITDVVSCLSYLKSREVFLYKMMGDPSHQAMLYFLEVLMNMDSSTGVSIQALAAHFHSRHFTADMKMAVGGEAGLKTFLLKYPSLFKVKGDLVSSVSLEGATSSLSLSGNESVPNLTHQVSNGHVHVRRDSQGSNTSSSTSGVATGNSASGVSQHENEFNLETEAVKFFQTRMSRKEDRWVPIKSLAGHLSQAPAEVRSVVGPQVEFSKFLARHKHVFEIQGELVGLRDTFVAQCLNSSVNANSSTSRAKGSRGLHHSHSARIARPKSLVMPPSQQGSCGSLRSAPTTPTSLQPPSTSTSNKSLSTSQSSGGLGPVSMTSSEYKSVMYLRKVIERKGGVLTLAKLFSVLSRSGPGVEEARNTIGWTCMELAEFVRKHSLFFEYHPSDDSINCRRAQKLNIIITGRKGSHTGRGTPGGSCDTAPRTLTNRKGRVFHVARLWGIIDLGRHEHVFFDKSLFKHVDDLPKHFKVNEMLYFNAILAPKESRAKWRATQVWKESDRTMMEKLSGPTMLNARSPGDFSMTQSPGLELADDIKFLSDDIDEVELRRVLEDDSYSDSRSDSISIPSPVLTPDEMPSSPVPLVASTPQREAPPVPARFASSCTKSYHSVSTQTLSTGEIMATQIYHDGMSKNP